MIRRIVMNKSKNRLNLPKMSPLELKENVQKQSTGLEIKRLIKQFIAEKRRIIMYVKLLIKLRTQ